MEARRLKLMNARKYFEVAKLLFLQHVCDSLTKARTTTELSKRTVANFLSLLPLSLLSEYSAFRKNGPLALNIPAVLAFLR